MPTTSPLAFDREGLASGHALQIRLVLRLDPRDADLAALGVPLVGIGGQEAAGDVADVAEHVGGRRPALGVGALRHRLHGHAGVLRLVCLQELHGVLRHPDRNRDRFIRAVLVVVDGVLHLLGCLADECRHHADNGRVRGCLGAREQDLLLRRVRDEHRPVAVDDLSTRGGHAHDTHLVARHRRGVALPLDHLQRPQSQHEDAEEEQDDDSDDAQAEIGTGLLFLGRADDGGHVDALAGSHARPRVVSPPGRCASHDASTAWGGAGRRGSDDEESASPDPAVGLGRNE